MPVLTPPSVAALPTPPSTASPSTFDARADAFLGALPANQTEVNALASNVFANATDAATSATTAAAQAATAAVQASAASASAVIAAASAGASAWVTGTTYALDAVRYSPINGRVYRRLIAGAGSTDPSADGTNWKAVDTGPVVLVVSTATFTAIAATHYVLTNAAAVTLTLPATPASGDTVWATFTNGLATNVIARNGQTIMALAEDMTIDSTAGLTVALRFVNASWRLI